MNSNEVEVLDNIPEPINKKKKKLKLIVIIILVLLVLTVGGLFFYKENVLLNKKTIIKNSIVEIFNVLNTKVDEVNKNIFQFDSNEESLGIDGTIEVDSNYKDDNGFDLSKLKDYKINFNGAIDVKNNKLSGTVNLKNNTNNNDLLTLNTYINGKYGLVESSQLSFYAYNYAINKEIKDINLNNKDNYDNIKRVINRTRDVIISKINENNITRDNVETSVNGKNVTYARFTYKININELTNDILKFYITDTSMLNTLSSITGINNDELKNYIQNIIDTNKGNETINYEIYVDGLFGKFKQLAIYNTNDSKTNLKLFNTDNGYKYEFNSNNNRTFGGNYSNNIFMIEKDKDNSVSLEKFNDNQYKINCKSNLFGNNYDVSANIKINKENDKQNIELSVNLLFGDNDKQNNINIKSNINIYKNGTIRPITAFITKDISTIDETELDNIMSKYNNIISNIFN